LTFPSFKRQVLDELGGDLAVALSIDEKYSYENPFWQHAKYRWTSPDFSDCGEGFDLAQRWLSQQYGCPAPDWRIMLQLKGIWQGGIASPDPQPSKSSILYFSRWLLLHGLQQDNVLDRYDRFVITRSDFVWLCPHPPLSVLDKDAIWFPDGENWGGLTDRHLVVSRADVVNCLNIIEDILLKPIQLFEEMKNLSTYDPWNCGRTDRLTPPFRDGPDDPASIEGHSAPAKTAAGNGWNIEQFLVYHLWRKGLLHKVKLFPYVMYLARSAHEGSSWGLGRYEPTVGHFVKYNDEFRTASAYATIIHSRTDWDTGAWRQFEPSSTAHRPDSLLRRLRYACERSYYDIHSALRRPDRFQRFARFSKRRGFF
jgi:hypothetical protein